MTVLDTLPTGMAPKTPGHRTDMHETLHAWYNDRKTYEVKFNNDAGDAALFNAASSAIPAGSLLRAKGNALNLTDCLRVHSFKGYDFSGAILGPANGANLDAILACSTWWDNSTSTNERMYVGHVKIAGNKTMQTGGLGHGFVARAWDSLFYDFSIWDTRGVAFRPSNESRNNTQLVGTSVNTTVATVRIYNPDSHGFYVRDGGNALTDWTCSDVWSAGANGKGLWLENSAGWYVANCHAYTSQDNAFQFDRAFGTRAESNYFESFGLAGQIGATYYGMHFGIQVYGAGTTILGNVGAFIPALPANGNFRFLAVSQNGVGVGAVTCVGNVLTGHANAREEGLWYNGGTGTLEIASTGNRCSGFQAGKDRVTTGTVTLSAGL